MYYAKIYNVWFLKQFIGFSVGRDPFFISKMTSGKFRILNNAVGTRTNCVKPHKFDHRYACGANTRCQISYYIPKHYDEEPSDVLRVLFNYIKSLKLWIL